jgi:PhnB protein
MVDAVPKDYPRITPYLLYDDVDAALDFVVAAFGFVERVRMPGPDGKAMHAEASIGDGFVMMGKPDDAGYRNPATLGGTTQLIYVYVEDVDAHFATATAAGATIVREPSDQFYGDRTYGAQDPEGHFWSFSQHIKDMGPDDFRS